MGRKIEVDIDDLLDLAFWMYNCPSPHVAVDLARLAAPLSDEDIEGHARLVGTEVARSKGYADEDIRERIEILNDWRRKHAKSGRP